MPDLHSHTMVPGHRSFQAPEPTGVEHSHHPRDPWKKLTDLLRYQSPQPVVSDPRRNVLATVTRKAGSLVAARYMLTADVHPDVMLDRLATFTPTDRPTKPLRLTLTLVCAADPRLLDRDRFSRLFHRLMPGQGQQLEHSLRWATDVLEGRPLPIWPVLPRWVVNDLQHHAPVDALATLSRSGHLNLVSLIDISAVATSEVLDSIGSEPPLGWAPIVDERISTLDWSDPDQILTFADRPAWFRYLVSQAPQYKVPALIANAPTDALMAVHPDVFDPDLLGYLPLAYALGGYQPGLRWLLDETRALYEADPVTWLTQLSWLDPQSTNLADAAATVTVLNA